MFTSRIGLSNLFTFAHIGSKSTVETVENSGAAASEDVVRRAFDSPNITSFVRRSLHSSVVLGKYVYIVGGEVVQIIDGTRVQLGMNSTLVIDMSSSWTNVTANVTALDIPSAPHFNLGSMWANSNGSIGYFFGGETGILSDEETIGIAVQLYRFDADGKGSGVWTTIGNPLDASGNLINRPVSGLATFGKEQGYMLGGHESQTSSSETSDLGGLCLPLIGLVEYNMSSNTWMNSSSSGYSVTGTAEGGSMEFVSIFGSAGLLMPFGGQSSSRTQWINDGTDEVSFSNLAIWDIFSKTWLFQTATGTIPTGRNFHCTVGLASPNGTFEIFLYGGQNGVPYPQTSSGISQELLLDEVFVLSLPAFVWFQASYPPANPRFKQTCHVVGNRQMLSIGGQDPSEIENSEWFITDPLKQGLGIFDLTEMVWSDAYDADAEAYQVPDVVNEWYHNNGFTPGHGWDNPGVKKLFTTDAKTTAANRTSNSTSSDGGSTAGPTTSPGNTVEGNSNTGKSNDIGLIAGPLIGGIALLGIIVCTFWIVRRCQRKIAKIDNNDSAEPEIPIEILDHHIPRERETRELVHELPQPGTNNVWEMDVAN